MITANIHVTADDRLIGVMVGEAPFPVLKIGDASIFPPDDAAAWLRRLAAAAEELAEQVELDAAPEPSVSEYHCRFCDARFGIAGEFTGSDDDYAAEEYYRAEVERHESGECAPGAALAERHMAEAMAKAGIGVTR